MTTLNLRAHKLYSDVKLPTFSTRGSACFDICAYYTPELGYDLWSDDRKGFIKRHDSNITIHPFQRVLVPTGLILDIPAGHSVRIHPRSGNAIKKGLSFINCEGVVDSDYTDPLMIPVINLSDIQTIVINNNDRIAQGELIRDLSYNIEEISSPPEQKTNREGGFGSTGV